MKDTLLTEYEPQQVVAQKRADDEDLDWLDLLLVLARRRRLIFYCTAVAMVVSAVVAFLLPVKYTATVRIMPPNQSNSASGLLSSIVGGSGGNLASSLLSGAVSLKNPSDVYVAMLKSRTLKDHLIDKFDLKDLYGKKTYVDARKKLEWNTDVTSGKEGVITLEFEDSDPKRAAAIAEGYLNELFSMSEGIASGEAGERRKFYERELRQQKDNLVKAEIDLKQVQQKTGLIMPSDQARAIIDNMARLRAMISAKEVQLGAMKAFATEQNPEYVQAQRELTELQSQLAKLQKSQAAQGEGDVLVPTSKVPESTLEFLRSYREFKYQETIYELLAKQYELARLDEARDYAPVQVLDHASVPDKRSKPYRLLIVALSTLAGLIVGCWVALLRGKQDRPRDAARDAKWRQIRDALSGGIRA
jgi:uncharacterized protein involved in exopolysaccharide biosynthesis